MPSGEITATAHWWPLRTEAEVEAARAEIYHMPDTTFSVSLAWSYTPDGAPYLQFTVTGAAGALTPECHLGDVLVKTGPMWETMTVDAARTRGMAIADLPEP